MKVSLSGLCILTLAVSIFGIISSAGADDAIQEAIAIIHPVAGEKVTGVLHIMPTAEGIRINGSFANLKPGTHGFHVHRYGNCTAPNDGSVGPHFSQLEAGKGYRGDLAHIDADAKGEAEYETVAKMLSLSGEYGIIGRAMVVHAVSGEKIGCGVIGIAK
jgi:Cu-Zn family superoxide dismutase